MTVELLTLAPPRPGRRSEEALSTPLCAAVALRLVRVFVCSCVRAFECSCVRVFALFVKTFNYGEEGVIDRLLHCTVCTLAECV